MNRARKSVILAALLLAMLATLTAAESSAAKKSRTQFLPDLAWPDDQGVPINARGGGVMFHAGTYHWFGQHMIASKAGNEAHVGVHCYSSTDLYNWKDAGLALKVSDDSKSDIAKGCILERPKVIFNAARSAVADSIWGPWKELGNPCIGVNPRNELGSELTFGGQSTCILPVNGRPGAFIAVFDIWRPNDVITGGYVWLPMTFEQDRFTVTWREAWDLSVFGKTASP